MRRLPFDRPLLALGLLFAAARSDHVERLIRRFYAAGSGRFFIKDKLFGFIYIF